MQYVGDSECHLPGAAKSGIKAMQNSRNNSGNGNPSQTRLFQIVLSSVAIVLFSCFVLVSPYLLQLPASVPAEADAIVILGGGKGDRVAKSLDLYRAGYARNLVLTGTKPSRVTSHQDVPDSRTEFLVNRQVPSEDISYLFPSENSWEEAHSALRMMQQLGWEKVIVVSDPPHMLRLSYVWGKAFRDYPKHFTLVATEPTWWSPLTWWGNRTSFAFVFSEILKLGYYVVAY
ncbi:YdcF family protein [Noviherbaspirillum cavernae]|nr:YdcF family protein [Noviherbaspirillum cavernae]